MAELFGVIAAAAQLASTCLATVELLSRIKGSASVLKGYQQQLQELRNLSISINTNPLLQTPKVGESICSLLRLVESSCLESLADKSRFHQTVELLQRERSLSVTFMAIERQKSSLSLLIEDIQARTLHQIQQDVRIMAGDKVPTSFPGHASSSFASSDLGPVKIASGQLLPSDNPVTGGGAWHTALVPYSSGGGPASTGEEKEYYERVSSSGSKRIAHYSGVVACPGVGQLNGNYYEGTGEMIANMAASNRDEHIIYKNMEKLGRGPQINGARVFVTDNGNGFQFPVLGADFQNIVHRGGSETGSSDIQVNGFEFHRGDKKDEN